MLPFPAFRTCLDVGLLSLVAAGAMDSGAPVLFGGAKPGRAPKLGPTFVGWCPGVWVLSHVAATGFVLVALVWLLHGVPVTWRAPPLCLDFGCRCLFSE